jgi:hypothetical protein
VTPGSPLGRALRQARRRRRRGHREGRARRVGGRLRRLATRQAPGITGAVASSR